MFSVSASSFNSLPQQIYAGRCNCSSDDEFDDDSYGDDFLGGWTRSSSKKSTIKNLIYDYVDASLNKKKMPKALKKQYRARMRKMKNPAIKALMKAFNVPRSKVRKSARAQLWSLFQGIRYPQARYLKGSKRKAKKTYTGPVFPKPTYKRGYTGKQKFKIYTKNGVKEDMIPIVYPSKPRKASKKKKSSFDDIILP